jgi:hypothetical protein
MKFWVEISADAGVPDLGMAVVLGLTFVQTHFISRLNIITPRQCDPCQ